MLLKIHKVNNPGRPVVSSVNSHTEKLSAYVNEFLRPIAEKLPSYIQDTTHFIKPSLEVEANVLFNGYIEETNHRICKFLCSVWLCTTQSSQRNAESAYTDSIGILADQRT